MPYDDVQKFSEAAVNKAKLLKEQPGKYFLRSVMAGFFIVVAMIFSNVVGNVFQGSDPAWGKLLGGIVFAIAVLLIVFIGAELFTGNNLVMTIGGLKKTVSWGGVVKLWVVCWIGNLIGSVVSAAIFTMTGIPGSGDIGAFFANAAAGKMGGTPANLFAKAILCNICVCVAIWCGTKLKSEGAKIAMNFCCVTTFVTCGFEHSIANMTFLSIGLMNQNGVAGITMGGFWYNLAIVTLGNMVGGILFVAIPYYLISGIKEK
mgnify:CR=1 FL=1